MITLMIISIDIKVNGDYPITNDYSHNTIIDGVSNESIMNIHYFPVLIFSCHCCIIVTRQHHHTTVWFLLA